MIIDKKVIVTSGGTQEYIDDVRVLTNISSGALGAIIADTLAQGGAQVDYVCGKNSAQPQKHWNVDVHTVRTAQDACDKLQTLVPKADALVHCMAVSDFTFRRDKSIKCKSSDPEAFIEYMRSTITTNPKIIGMVKSWNPRILLVGFKFEVGISTEELIALAQSSILKNSCDLVVANDKKEMESAGIGYHVAHLVYSEDWKKSIGAKDVTVHTKNDIALNIRNFLKESIS